MISSTNNDKSMSSSSSPLPSSLPSSPPAWITILGFGSLLSEKSSRMTFPNLENFRLGRVPNYRRLFRQPTSLFFRHGIANLETKEMSSLSAEPCTTCSSALFNDNDNDNDNVDKETKCKCGFVCSVFEVPNDGMMESDGVPSAAFLEREEEYNIIQAEYIDLSLSASESASSELVVKKKGILCTASTDEVYLQRWGLDHFHQRYGQYGISTIWGWKEDSGLLPCPVYLRHCYLAAKSLGPICFDSFLDETYLVDRKTTIREYMEGNNNNDRKSRILNAIPPPELLVRYSG